MVALSLLLEPQEDMRPKYFGFGKSSKINLKVRMKAICVCHCLISLLHFITQPCWICTRLRWICLGVSSNGRKFSSPQGFTASLVRGSEQQWPCHSAGRGLANSKPVPRILVTPVTKAVTRWFRWDLPRSHSEWSAVVWVVATLKAESISGVPHGVAIVRRHKKVDVLAVLGWWLDYIWKVTTIQVTRNTCEGFFLN